MNYTLELNVASPDNDIKRKRGPQRAWILSTIILFEPQNQKDFNEAQIRVSPYQGTLCYEPDTKLPSDGEQLKSFLFKEKTIKDSGFRINKNSAVPGGWELQLICRYNNLDGNKCNFLRKYVMDDYKKWIYILHFGSHICNIIPNLALEELNQISTVRHGMIIQQKQVINGILEEGRSQLRDILTRFITIRNTSAPYSLLPDPSLKPLKNYLYNMKLKAYGPTGKTSVESLLEWAQDNSFIPDDPDKVYVVNFWSNVTDVSRPKFRILLSSKRLLSICHNPPKAHADGTYKLNIDKCPGFLFGFSDRNRTFHTVLFGIGTNEKANDFSWYWESWKHAQIGLNPKYMMADAALAISNGFTIAFEGGFRRLMCYAHVYRNIKTHMGSFSNDSANQYIKKSFLADLNLLADAWYEHVFDKAAQLFLIKWRSSTYNNRFRNTLDHLENFWLDPERKYWYNGAALGCVRNNNGLESTNRYIKSDMTRRRSTNYLMKYGAH